MLTWAGLELGPAEQAMPAKACQIALGLTLSMTKVSHTSLCGPGQPALKTLFPILGLLAADMAVGLVCLMEKSVSGVDDAQYRQREGCRDSS